MNVAVYGYTDKRVLIMSLMKILQTTGEILLVTDDRHYVRYTEDKTSYGYFHNTTIMVTDLSPDQVSIMPDLEMDRYRHVIYDLRTYLYEGADISIYIAPINVDEDERTMMMNIMNVTPLYVKYSGMKEQGDLVMRRVSKIKAKKIEEGADPEDLEDEDISPEEDEDLFIVTEFPESLKIQKGKNVFTMTHSLICQLEISESTRAVPTFSDNQLAKVLHGILGPILDCDLKLITSVLKEKI